MLNFGLDSDYKDLLNILKMTKQGQKFLNDLEKQTKEIEQLREYKISNDNRIKNLEYNILNKK